MDHSEKELSRFDVCFESVDRDVQRKPEGASLCLHGSRESLLYGTQRGTVQLHEEVRSSGEACEGGVTVMGSRWEWDYIRDRIWETFFFFLNFCN